MGDTAKLEEHELYIKSIEIEVNCLKNRVDLLEQSINLLKNNINLLKNKKHKEITTEQEEKEETETEINEKVNILVKKAGYADLTEFEEIHKNSTWQERLLRLWELIE